MKVDVSMLDELVREYCVYRGIVDSGLALPSGDSPTSISVLDFIHLTFPLPPSNTYTHFMIALVPGLKTLAEPLKVGQSEPGYCSSRNYSFEGDNTNSKHSDGETSVSNAHMNGSPEDSVDVNSIQGTDVELRYACESTNYSEDCSTSGSHQAGISKVLQRNRNYTTGERSKRKRWRGRQDDEDYKQDVNATSTDLSREQQVATW